MRSSPKSFVTNFILKSALLLMASAIAYPLHALEFECESGADKRFIRMELPGISHLCEVTVTYTNNERKVMWYADNDSMFCSEKTVELTKKYQSKWGFECQQWPDHDGIDQLDAHERTIVDTELKQVIEKGKIENVPYLVEGIKAASNTKNANNISMLVLQFFLHEPDNGVTRDITHVISDNGTTYNLLSRLDSLTSYVDANEGYIVNSALISAVTDNGAMEVITVLDSEAPAASGNSSAGCYGNQTLTQQDDGGLVARTPHRFVCPDNDAG